MNLVDIFQAVSSNLMADHASLKSGKNVRFWNFKLRFDSESGQTNDIKINIYFTGSLLDVQH